MCKLFLTAFNAQHRFQGVNHFYQILLVCHHLINVLVRGRYLIQHQLVLAAFDALERRTAFMPQPISTPTAAGMIALSVAMTVPTVLPLPRWQSGISATPLRSMKGRRARFLACARASSSMSAQALMGLDPSSVDMFFICSDKMLLNVARCFWPRLSLNGLPLLIRLFPRGLSVFDRNYLLRFYSNLKVRNQVGC